MKITGARKIIRTIRRIPIEARKEMSAAVNKGADELVTLQKAAAPRDKGNLVASIRKESGGRSIGSQLSGDAGLAVSVVAGGPLTTKEVRGGSGVDYDYALGVEFGTVDTARQPFFYGSYRLTKKRITSRVSRAMRKSIKRAVS